MTRTDVIRVLSEVIDAQAEARPGAPALRDERRALSYRDLAERTRSIAASLLRLGVDTGEAVAVFMGNRAEWIEASLGIVGAGAVTVPIPPNSTPDDVAFILADTRARLLFVDPDCRDLVLEAMTRHPELPELSLVVAGGDATGAEHAFDDLAASSPTGGEARRGAIDDTAWIYYTSGTTGRPKGVLLSQRGMMWVAAAGWLPFLKWTSDDCILCPLPLSHAYALGAALAGFAAGGEVFVLGRPSPTMILDALDESDVTVLLGVPTLYSYLLSESSTGRTYDRRTLRMCISAGALLPQLTAARAAKMFGAPVLEAYGATEATNAITLSPFEGRTPEGSCGLPLLGMTVRIVDPTTRLDRAAGEEGEVIISGPGVMKGYHERPEETRDAIREGWLHTGDIGRLDENGFLRITGRIKDIIIRGGENIAPAEIEIVAIEHPHVLDCGVVGVPHETLGEVPVLGVVTTDSGDHELVLGEIAGYCREMLPSSKCPERLVRVDAIPRTVAGKVIRDELRDLIL